MVERLLIPLVLPFVLAAGAISPIASPVNARVVKDTATYAGDYEARKPALKAARETKRDFLAACRALPVGTPTPVGAAPRAASAAPTGVASGSGLKSAATCDAEYKADEAAPRVVRERKKDFPATCRALPTARIAMKGAGGLSTSDRPTTWP